MISSKSCFSVLAGREWDVRAGGAKLWCHHTWLQPFPAHVSSLAVPSRFVWNGGGTGLCRGRWVCSVQRHPGVSHHCTNVVHTLRPHLCSFTAACALLSGCSSGAAVGWSNPV